MLLLLLKLLLLPLKLLLLPLKLLLLPLKLLLLPLKPLLLPLKLPLLLLKPLRLLLKPPPLKPQSNTYFRCQKAGVGRLFFVLFFTQRAPDGLQTSSRHPKPLSWLATPIQSGEQFSAEASASLASSGRLFCSLRCAASTCCSCRVLI